MTKNFKLILLAIGGICQSVFADDSATTPDRYSTMHAQGTFVEQGVLHFPSEYSGTGSLSNKNQSKETITSTLFLGHTLWEGAQIYFNPETAQGHGLSQTYGVGGFPNGEATKVGSDNFKLYTARLYLSQTFNLGDEKEKIADDQNQIATTKSVSRITITAGKFATNDFFDNNTYSHDARHQFLNWSIMNSGAWDFPADARGYDKGVMVELNQKNWALRYGAFLEPYMPNGKWLPVHGTESLGHVAELEERYKLFDQPGKTRFLVFLNEARQGDYQQAFDEATAQNTDINTAMTNVARYGNKKYGFAINNEQQITDNIGSFLRISWNNGKTQDFAFTQIDQSVAGGVVFSGKAWNRADDNLGLAIAVNGISKEQQRYLANGGVGLIVGDGYLNYGLEQIFETYYSYKVNSYLFLSPDFQAIANPGYNKERGPVYTFSIRAHIDL